MPLRSDKIFFEYTKEIIYPVSIKQTGENYVKCLSTIRKILPKNALQLFKNILISPNFPIRFSAGKKQSSLHQTARQVDDKVHYT